MARTLLSAVKVRQYRERLGLLQNQAANLAGWLRGQSWHKLETHNSDVRISTLVTVANVLGCKIADLLISVPGESKSAARYRRSRR
jgi:DNA-binding XRE family transcriptional regulator